MQRVYHVTAHGGEPASCFAYRSISSLHLPPCPAPTPPSAPPSSKRSRAASSVSVKETKWAKMAEKKGAEGRQVITLPRHSSFAYICHTVTRRPLRSLQPCQRKQRKLKQATRCTVFSHFSILLLIHMLSLNHGPYHLVCYRAWRGNQVRAPLSSSPHSADIYPTHPTCFPHHHLGSTSATAIQRSLPPTHCACPVHIQKKVRTPSHVCFSTDS